MLDPHCAGCQCLYKQPAHHIFLSLACALASTGELDEDPAALPIAHKSYSNLGFTL